jgi:biopolymer transport protein TolR
MAGGLMSRNGRGRGRYRQMSDINVTPLVDVMLVLLIIFMVTAPMMTSGVNVDLPKTEAKPLNTDAKPVTVSINADGKIYLQDESLELADLVDKLTAVTESDKDRRIFVRADKGISYGQVMQVMATVAQGGFTKVALLAEQPPGTAPPKPGG